jgi:predicted secreted protein
MTFCANIYLKIWWMVDFVFTLQRNQSKENS